MDQEISLQLTPPFLPQIHENEGGSDRNFEGSVKKPSKIFRLRRKIVHISPLEICFLPQNFSPAAQNCSHFSKISACGAKLGKQLTEKYQLTCELFFSKYQLKLIGTVKGGLLILSPRYSVQLFFRLRHGFYSRCFPLPQNFQL